MPTRNPVLLARLVIFPEVTVYHAARSFLGQNGFAADFRAPVEADFVSVAKLTA